MVTRFLMLSVVATMAMTAQAQKAELTFGIESAFDKKGIVAVDYNLDNKKIHVVYKTKKWNEASLHKLATGVGHDTDKYQAADEVYANLHGCCKYREHTSCPAEDNNH